MGSRRQSWRFVILYALAVAGGSASYAPFLTIVLPRRVLDLADTQAVQVLSSIALVGAISASLANILFGWLSDRTHDRKRWIAGGLAVSSGLLVSMRFVETVPQLLAMMFAWQAALNMMLGPLSAWAGDCIPDEQKGTLGGLLSLAPGIGALAGALVTIPGLAGPDGRLVLIAALVCALVLPVLLLGRPIPMPHLMEDRMSRPAAAEPAQLARPAFAMVSRMWLARLLVQIAEAALFAFLLLWLSGIDRRLTDNNVATIFTVTLFGSVPVAMAAGRWSDRAGRPIRPLLVATACGAAGLVIMAASRSTNAAIAGYCLFGISAAVFLALHTSQTLRVLPRASRRGRDLGLFNLTNTIPSLMMPALSLALIPAFGFQALFFALAGLVAAAGLLLASGRLR